MEQDIKRIKREVQKLGSPEHQSMKQIQLVLKQLYQYETEIGQIQKKLEEKVEREGNRFMELLEEAKLVSSLVQSFSSSWLKEMQSGPPEIKRQDIKLVKKLGSGDFADVYQAKVFECDVAVKIPKNQDAFSSSVRSFRDELAIMKKIFHPNVLLCIGGCVEPPNVSIVLELMKMTFEDFMTNETNQYQSKTIVERLKWVTDISKGLVFLHQAGFVHRDLKLDNILLDAYFNAKVSDFGLSAKQVPYVDTQEAKGNLLYRAPEVWALDPRMLSDKADVFSFGILAWEMFIGKPFEPPKAFSTVEGYRRYICTHKFRPALPKANGWPKELESLIDQCWQHEPRDRPNMQTVIQVLRELEFILEVRTVLQPNAQAFWIRFFNGHRQVDWRQLLKVLKSIHHADETSAFLRSLAEVFLYDQSSSITLAKFQEVNRVFGDFFEKGYPSDRLSFVFEPWFHGPLIVDQAVARLNGRPKYFLVRYGSTSPFTVSWNNGTSIQHSKINYENNQYVAFGHQFATLKDCLACAAKNDFFSLSLPCPNTAADSGYFVAN